MQARFANFSEEHAPSVFLLHLQVPRADKMLATVAAAARNGLGSDGWLTEPSGNVYMHRWVPTIRNVCAFKTGWAQTAG
eukprot:scaffold54772_cov17-Tisochrysis_lutea.AAC.1